jgi:hypothetical protein
MLGLAPASNGQQRVTIAPGQENRPYIDAQTGEHVKAPVRRAMAAPVSAPPTREVPSMTTGRPYNARRPLTAAEREAAQFSGISEEEYLRQREKQDRLKASGVISDGR